ncbi:MAG: N-acetylneuraminate synthase family protein [Clostridiales bacterium]|nr:N-acetylneuraminate synthase family protein [Clostridiales bacterium]
MEKKYAVIAEVAGGHMGSLERCLELVQAAVQCRADAVKFQFYKAHELCQIEHSDYELFKKLEFTVEDWKKIFNEARTGNLAIYADIFGPDSFAEACLLGVDAFKLHAADIDNASLIETVAAKKKPILLGIGGHKRVEIYRSVKKIRSISSDTLIVLMPGHQLFPTPVSEHSLDEIRWFSQAYADMGVAVGCADHIDGDDPMAVAFPLAAIGAGATMIEKHITIDRSQRWEDYESALEPEAFSRLAALAHGMNNLGQGFPIWTEGRQRYREKAVKTYFLSQDVPKNLKIEHNHLKCLRPTVFTNPLPSDFFINSRTLRAIKADSLMTGSDISQNVGILINCRTASTRLPNKALKKICGKETIVLLIERMKYCSNTNQIILCTTERAEDDVLVDIANREGIEVFRGPDENVALRLLLASRKYNLDHIVRVTGDDLLRDIPLIDQAIESHLKNHADYTYMKGVVYSCDTEIISVRALETIVDRAACPENTEYLTWYLEDKTAFVHNEIHVPSDYYRDYRITLDTIEDFKLLEALHEALYKPGHPIDLRCALRYMDKHPELTKINAAVRPKLSRNDIDVSMRI